MPTSVTYYGTTYERERQRFEEATDVTFFFPPEPKPLPKEQPMTIPTFGTLPPKTTTPAVKTAPVVLKKDPAELREALQKGWVEVTFTKSNGDVVTMSATTDLTKVPKELHPAPKAPAVSIQQVVGMPSPQFVGEAQKPQDPNHITFYSPDRNGWRSLRMERLVQAFRL